MLSWAATFVQDQVFHFLTKYVKGVSLLQFIDSVVDAPVCSAF